MSLISILRLVAEGCPLNSSSFQNVPKDFFPIKESPFKITHLLTTRKRHVLSLNASFRHSLVKGISKGRECIPILHKASWPFSMRPASQKRARASFYHVFPSILQASIIEGISSEL